MRNDPRSARKLTYVSLAMTPVLLILTIANVAILLSRGLLTALLPVTIALVGLVCLVIVRALGALRVLNAHIRDDGGHVCQCAGCGQDLAPGGPPVTVPVRPQQTPHDRRLAGIYLAGLGVVLILAGLSGIMIALLTDSPDGAVLVPANILFAVMGLAIIARGLFLRSRAGTELTREHPCACRWCGAPGRALAPGRAR